MSIRKRKWTSGGKEKEKWVLDYVDQRGKRRQKTYPTQKKAKEEETRILTEISSGRHVADRDSITIEQASKVWISSWDGENLEESSTTRYMAVLKNNILPFVGYNSLNKFTIHDVIAFQEELKVTPCPPDYPDPRMRGKKRSRDAVRRAAMVLGAIFAAAELRGLATHNPVYAIPRRKRPYRRTDRERLANRPQMGVDIPTLDEINLILDHACGHYSWLIHVAVFCGLRASELRGLRWSDIDFQYGVLHVRQRADFRNTLGAPKSKAGMRTVAIPPSLLDDLKEWKTACPAGQLNLVFPNTNGAVASHKAVIEASLHPTMARAGLMVNKGKVDKHGEAILSPKYSGLHALRHFYASWCINRTEDGGLGLMAKQVQERMGHANIQITMDTCGHLFPMKDEGEALRKAEHALRRNRNATKPAN